MVSQENYCLILRMLQKVWFTTLFPVWRRNFVEPFSRYLLELYLAYSSYSVNICRMNPVFLIALFSRTGLLFEHVTIVPFPLLEQFAVLLKNTALQPAPLFIYCYLQENNLGRTDSHGTPQRNVGFLFPCITLELMVWCGWKTVGALVSDIGPCHLLTICF